MQLPLDSCEYSKAMNLFHCKNLHRLSLNGKEICENYGKYQPPDLSGAIFMKMRVLVILI